ncbi:MAG: hypothetical protein DWQ37_00300 [Planctomycetota bacterium]|nr:MAG: hypothetical protein DWQ37_00300 [Planctomycetota bacterium]
MYAFVHIEKTAGTTLNSILRRSFGTRHCDVRLPVAKRFADRRDQRVCVEAADLRRVQRLYRRLRGIAGHNVKPYADLEAACPEIRFITLLRDPASRFRSHFLNRGEGPGRAEFERWIAQPWVHNWQTKMIAGEANAAKAIELIATRFGYVGLTERFDESLLLLGDWLQEPDFEPAYRPRNQLARKTRPRDKMRARIDMSYLELHEVRGQISDANAEDQRVYDYVLEHVYPRQQAAYAGNLENDVWHLKQLLAEVGTLSEPVSGRLMRNYVYKPLLHCQLV